VIKNVRLTHPSLACYVFPFSILRQLVDSHHSEIHRIRFTHSVSHSKSFVTFNVSSDIADSVSHEVLPQEYSPCNVDTAPRPSKIITYFAVRLDVIRFINGG
jgi:hypothetical protein